MYQGDVRANDGVGWPQEIVGIYMYKLFAMSGSLKLSEAHKETKI